MARILEEKFKQAGEAVAYQFQWSGDLNSSTISSASFAITPSGLTTDTSSNTTTTHSIRVSGGTPGTRYEIESTVITAASETLKAAIGLTVQA